MFQWGMADAHTNGPAPSPRPGHRIVVWDDYGDTTYWTEEPDLTPAEQAILGTDEKGNPR